MTSSHTLPTLVFAHYFGGSAQSWAGLVQAIGEQVRCIAPSLAGFGGTVPPEAGPGLDVYADQMEATAGQSPWIAVGHSMGGKIALAVAARAPKDLQALILIAPSPPTPEPMAELDRRKTIADFGDRAAARSHIEQIVRSGLASDILDRCITDEVSVAQPAWLWWLEQGSREDISEQTSGIVIPTLVMAGDKDVVLGLGTPRKIVEGIAGARMEIIKDGGHLVPLEQPVAVAALIQRFLADHWEPA